MPDQLLTERLDILEKQLETLETLPARMTAVESQIVQLRDEMRDDFSAIRAESRAGDEGTGRRMGALHQETRMRITDGDEETRREMQALHQQTLARIESINEEMHALHQQTLVRVTDGDEETRRHMRLLHEEVISRLALIQEDRSQRDEP